VSALDRDLLDAFVPEFEAEAVRLAMVRDAAGATRALDQLRAMAAALGAPSLGVLLDRAAAALDPLDLPALGAVAEALAAQAKAIGAAGADVPPPAPPGAVQAAEAPRAASIDRELLEAFAPEFDVACDRLGAATDDASAGRALDALRAMAGTAGLASLRSLLERGLPLLEAGDLPGLAALAAAAREHAARILVAGEDLPPPDAAPAPPAAIATATLDPELLDAFLPDFLAGCRRLGEAAEPSAARRAVEALAAMAATLGLGSLAGMLAAAPADPAALAPFAAALARQAEAIAAAGHDLPAPGATKRRVLVVDDSAMMRRLVSEIIAADPDFELVGEAPDGCAALSAMAALRPDLTLLDIEMPELDGIGVLRHWSLRGAGAVVVVSSAARPGSATAIEARRLGAAGIVGKPSGALSPDLRERQGAALRRTARRAAGLPEIVA
jgi:CheY-like chemotaxis protein